MGGPKPDVAIVLDLREPSVLALSRAKRRGRSLLAAAVATPVPVRVVVATASLASGFAVELAGAPDARAVTLDELAASLPAVMKSSR